MFKVCLFKINHLFIFNNSFFIIESRNNLSQSSKNKVLSANIVELHIKDEHIKYINISLI